MESYLSLIIVFICLQFDLPLVSCGMYLTKKNLEHDKDRVFLLRNTSFDNNWLEIAENLEKNCFSLK